MYQLLSPKTYCSILLYVLLRPQGSKIAENRLERTCLRTRDVSRGPRFYFFVLIRSLTSLENACAPFCRVRAKLGCTKKGKGTQRPQNIRRIRRDGLGMWRRRQLRCLRHDSRPINIKNRKRTSCHSLRIRRL